MANDKLLRGRKLVVTFAHQAPIDQMGGGSSIGTKRKGMMETGRPTTLSMLKTGMSGRNDGCASGPLLSLLFPRLICFSRTRDKIAMMEAKLRQMERTNPKPTPAASSSDATPTASTSTPYHPSLPIKPPEALPTKHPSNHPLTQPLTRPTPKPKTPLPSLPILPPSNSNSRSRPLITESKSNPLSARQAKSSKMIGVKIGKTREKQTQPDVG